MTTCRDISDYCRACGYDQEDAKRCLEERVRSAKELYEISKEA